MGSGDCLDESGNDYDDYLKDNVPLQECEDRCEAEPACRGIRYGYVNQPNKCYLKFDDDLVPTAPEGWWRRIEKSGMGEIQRSSETGHGFCCKKDTISTSNTASAVTATANLARDSSSSSSIAIGETKFV